MDDFLINDNSLIPVQKKKYNFNYFNIFMILIIIGIFVLNLIIVINLTIFKNRFDEIHTNNLNEYIDKLKLVLDYFCSNLVKCS